ncbi:MAG: tagaturonate reductase [Flavobacteriaceae bacterium]|nr:tagaturonate reductase [Flavobacteriaceae bacterium]
MDDKLVNQSVCGLPIKVVQFGEGNFLRSFVCDVLQRLNDINEFNGSIAIIQPIEKGKVDLLAQQKGKYTLFLKGIINRKEIQEIRNISCVQEYINPYKNFEDFINLAKTQTLKIIVSNTTEKGIAFNTKDSSTDSPAGSFVGKLVQFLYTRFVHFNGDETKGLHILPCELIDENGLKLQGCITDCITHWGHENSFLKWVQNSCFFYNTLVDRIVPGYPSSEPEKYHRLIGFKDQLITVSEPYFLWVIEGNEGIKELIQSEKINLDIRFSNDLHYYRLRKIRFLNGIHTLLVPIGLYLKKTTVLQCMEDHFVFEFVKGAMVQEISMTLKHQYGDLKEKTKNHPINPKVIDRYIREVIDRLKNPFIEHNLTDIGLYSLEKFVFRVLPTILDYHKRMGLYPLRLIFGFACLLLMTINGEIDTKDNSGHLSFLRRQKSKPTFTMVKEILSNQEIWKRDLTKQPLLTEILYYAIVQLKKHGLIRGFYFYYRNQTA